MAPQEVNKCFQKFYLPEENMLAKIVILPATNELKIIIFVFNYLTVLVYASWLGKFLQLATSTSVSNCYLLSLIMGYCYMSINHSKY